ncbi:MULTISPECIES: hypothetical protein [Maricaulis]|jgi:hypothetical protein|uniref:hypothetical protein n=1 Tax=Maricaulis TaxID=74317 RepID=UPI0012322A31|nr:MULTISPECIES: hypothetical protein [Maricaulis]
MYLKFPNIIALVVLLLALSLVGASGAMLPIDAQNARDCHTISSATCCEKTGSLHTAGGLGDIGICEACDNARCTVHHTFSSVSINRADGQVAQLSPSQTNAQTTHDRFRATTHPVPKQPPRQ